MPSLGRRTLVGRKWAGQKLGSLCTEFASDLNTNYYQPATARPAELGVGVGAGSLDCKARLHIGPRMGFASPRRRRDDGGIEREVGAVPLATTWMRLSSLIGKSGFMSAKRTCFATRAPASRQTRATACSRGRTRLASTPEVAHAERWSPSESSRPSTRSRRP